DRDPAAVRREVRSGRDNPPAEHFLRDGCLMDLLALSASVCILGSIVLALVSVQAATASPRAGIERRLGRLMGESLGSEWESINTVEGLRRHREDKVPIIGSLIRGRNWVHEAAENLERADLRLTVSEYVAIRIFAALLLGAVGFLLLGTPLGLV